MEHVTCGGSDTNAPCDDAYVTIPLDDAGLRDDNPPTKQRPIDMECWHSLLTGWHAVACLVLCTTLFIIVASM
jgi:hypothetical protein